MIEIDGSHGEGGGQILRTALALSCLFRKPFRIFNIRRNRKKPGMMPQHLAAVRAMQRISGAKAVGDEPGSIELSFSPGDVSPGDYVFDIGTAGSATLLLQTLLPPLLFAGDRSTLTLTGGTHVPFSPSFHYVSGIFAPVLARLGIEVRLSIESYGFYPRGGGKILAEILPAGELSPLKLAKRGKILDVTGCSVVGRLPVSIAERQRNEAAERIRAGLKDVRFRLGIDIQNAPTPGRGTFLYLQSASENAAAGFTSLGAIGKRAETVGTEAAEDLLGYCSTGAVLDPHLPDQIALYLSLCKGESVLTTSYVTHHLLTNLWVIARFHAFTHSLDGEVGKPGSLAIHSNQ